MSGAGRHIGAPAIARHISEQRRQDSAHRAIRSSSGIDMHASAHRSQACAHIMHISFASGERRIIMSAHIRVISEQSRSARMIRVCASPPVCRHALMVSSHTPWQAMHAWMQSCVSLLSGSVAGCC
ncbi:hypothetical protein GCM10010233_47720 [Streptomyces pseudogriseolus]|nr:hypothetical protein GCM10010233_47720 [Streptomyces gancidicus]